MAHHLVDGRLGEKAQVGRAAGGVPDVGVDRPIALVQVDLLLSEVQGDAADGERAEADCVAALQLGHCARQEFFDLLAFDVVGEGQVVLGGA